MSQATFIRFSRGCGVLTAAVGAIVLLGWLLDVPALKSISPGYVSMKANTAICFAMLGLALAVPRGPKARAFARGLSAAVIAIGGMTLAEYVSGSDFGIDGLLFREAPGAVGTSHAGRMAPSTAFSFLLAGMSLLLAEVEIRGRPPAQILTLALALVAFLALLGYGYGVRTLYGVAGYTQMAVHTAATFLLLAAGILLARPGRGFMTVLTDEGTAGILARRLMAAGVLIPILIGWLRVRIQRTGLFEPAFLTSLFVCLFIIVFNAMVWTTVARIYRVESERRRAEGERDRYFNDSMDLLCVAGVDGYFKRPNPAWERTLGISVSELLSKPFIEFVHPEDRASTNAESVKVNAGADVTQFENRYRCRDGTYRWLAWTARAPAPGEPLIIASARDITERKRAEERLRVVVESAPNALIMVGRGGRITLANVRTEMLFGYDRRELIGQPIEMLVPDRFRNGHAGLRDGFTAAPQARAMGAGRDLFGRRKDGTEVPIEIGLGPIEFPEGPQVIASIIDITERKRGEEEIRRLNVELEQRIAEATAVNKELEAFSYSVSHDLRAPLRAIDGFSRILLEECAERLDAEGKRCLNVVVQNTKQMGQLIDDLLGFSRLGRKTLEVCPIDMAELARAVFAELRRANADRAIDFRLGEMSHAVGDPAMIRLVFANLISNAIKYTRGRTPAVIEVAGRHVDGESTYHVKDNGVGFDMQYVSKLFGVFQRLHAPQDFDGTGVGLALVQRIVQRHGGRVWAEASVNGGATFYFTLAKRGGTDD